MDMNLCTSVPTFAAQGCRAWAAAGQQGHLLLLPVSALVAGKQASRVSSLHISFFPCHSIERFSLSPEREKASWGLFLGSQGNHLLLFFVLFTKERKCL